ncbi:hypothetical protein K469DRAFT_688775 [Zopfia rhizophila CBS 207.26]|uniref:Uncharacterized protein n=1 Tax=Zopfia rhizophila CBS 207.26 TaxID=1314779 RepID=A0A6A6DZ29_9PEZI|nr:hypothetical protein K469DRAFT_688775 [Zopfia rhizophila CBS 207.26]
MAQQAKRRAEKTELKDLLSESRDNSQAKAVAKREGRLRDENEKLKNEKIALPAQLKIKEAEREKEETNAEVEKNKLRLSLEEENSRLRCEYKELAAPTETLRTLVVVLEAIGTEQREEISTLEERNSK